MTALVVVLLGAQAFSDTFGAEVGGGSVSKAALMPHTILARSPASVPPSAGAPEGAAPAPARIPSTALTPTMEWNWNCKSTKPESTEVQTNFLRFKGRACGMEVSEQKLTLTNETNGFTASIFPKGKAAYETDMIQLRQGTNRLRLQYVNSAGRRIESFFTVVSSL